MNQKYTYRLCLLAVFGVWVGTLQLPAQSSAPVAANDNRSPAGELTNGVLTLRLEIGEGQWYPGSEQGESVPIHAFGEVGKPLQNPGPLIRVPQGTVVQATVHNSLSLPTTVHGLFERPGEDKNPIVVQPGATQDVRFETGAPGTYYYWATTTGATLGRRTNLRIPKDTQLQGAIVIDPSGAVSDDRVFLLGLWYWPAYRAIVQDPNYREIPTINGKVWPYTERFTFNTGDNVHWRWINVTTSGHSMHLHGFYFNLNAMGDDEKDRKFTDAERRRVVTHHINGGETFDMTFIAERAGRWLMHCHMLEHMMAVHSPTPRPFAPVSLATGNAAGHAAMHAAGHGSEPEDAGMSGMILGITILDKENAQAKSSDWKAERKLQLIIGQRKSGPPLYQLTLRDAAKAPPSPSADAALMGPPIVLTQDQSVEIEVVNNMKAETAIHWHGIELESYYDGVPRWTGTSKQVTPPIAAGKSFIVRMKPPKAGTFIYHTHWNDLDQLKNGVYGPLIVMPPGQQYDPRYDRTFVLAQGTINPFGDLLVINGDPQPTYQALETVKKYRFRFINITPDEPGLVLKMLRANVTVQWRPLAKDGADLPTSKAVLQKAEMIFSVGETHDFEYQADKREEVVIDFFHPRLGAHITQNLLFGVAPR